ncbi:hypothetical protein PHYPSEUDO_012327 [Phytophthora pseudosyringae]|uniref:Uncharacterized protein n=1 Tax=Phytophthora pseudosyringae TaxID=221518 RepID=A0A8T1VA72_9STRA|nr:hypothetical protein PHYPSEUDO_012327 [Phytophthora pseudosyringae]
MRGLAAADKALVADVGRNVTGLNELTATKLTGEIQTGYLKYNGTLVVGGTIISESEIVHLTGATPGTLEVLKATVTNSGNNIHMMNEFVAATIRDPRKNHHDGQPAYGAGRRGRRDRRRHGNLCDKHCEAGRREEQRCGRGEGAGAGRELGLSVGVLDALAMARDVTVGTAVISETDLKKIDAVTNGIASMNMAIVVDGSMGIAGIGSLSATKLVIGAPVNHTLPVEIGFVPYMFTGNYAYGNDARLDS